LALHYYSYPSADHDKRVWGALMLQPRSTHGAVGSYDPFTL